MNHCLPTDKILLNSYEKLTPPRKWAAFFSTLRLPFRQSDSSLVSMRISQRHISGLILCILLAMTVPSVAAEEQISEFQVRSFTAQCIDLLRQERFDLVAGLFHQGSGAKAEQVDFERHQLATGLAQLRGIFGDFSQVQIPETEQRSHQFEIQGMTSAYWRERPRHFQVVYSTDFSRLGAGALVFRVVVYDHRLQLRSLAYALSADAPGADLRKAEIEAQMQTFFEHLQSGRR